MRAKAVVLGLTAVLVLGTSLHAWSANAPKVGDICKKIGHTKTYKEKKFTCIKLGKKLVWTKGVAVNSAKEQATPATNKSPSPSPSPEPKVIPSPIGSPSPVSTPGPSVIPTSSPTPSPTVTPKTFEDLYENRKGISYAAWTRSSEIISVSKAKVGTLEIHTGPNTKPYFDDYLTAVSLVSRLFPNRLEPSKTLIIRYNFKDLEWAEKLTKEKLTAEEYSQLQSAEENRLVGSNCDTKTQDCRGAKQQTTPTSRVSVILQGIENALDVYDPTAEVRSRSGMLEAHEYFHALQRIPIMDKTRVWPHAWFREGSANWVQNIVINNKDFDKYREYIRQTCSPICLRLSEAQIIEFFETSNENYTAPKFDRWLNYSLSSHVIEALVALKGPDTLIDFYEQMGKKLTFDQAFMATYGVEWSYALPILAKTVYANLNGL